MKMKHDKKWRNEIYRQNSKEEKLISTARIEVYASISNEIYFVRQNSLQSFTMPYVEFYFNVKLKLTQPTISTLTTLSNSFCQAKMFINPLIDFWFLLMKMDFLFDPVKFKWKSHMNKWGQNEQS